MKEYDMYRSSEHRRTIRSRIATTLLLPLTEDTIISVKELRPPSSYTLFKQVHYKKMIKEFPNEKPAQTDFRLRQKWHQLKEVWGIKEHDAIIKRTPNVFRADERLSNIVEFSNISDVIWTVCCKIGTTMIFKSILQKVLSPPTLVHKRLYDYFCDINREKKKREFPDAKGKEIQKLLANDWNKFKKSFEFNELKQEHKLARFEYIKDLEKHHTNFSIPQIKTKQKVTIRMSYHA